MGRAIRYVLRAAWRINDGDIPRSLSLPPATALWLNHQSAGSDNLLTVQPAWQPVAVGGNQVVNKSIYFVNAQHGGEYAGPSCGVVNTVAIFRKNSFGQQRLYVDVGLHQGGQMRR